MIEGDSVTIGLLYSRCHPHSGLGYTEVRSWVLFQIFISRKNHLRKDNMVFGEK